MSPLTTKQAVRLFGFAMIILAAFLTGLALPGVLA